MNVSTQCNGEFNSGRAVVMAMLLPPPTKPITMPSQHGFSRGEKKRVRLATYKGRGVSYRKIGRTTMAVTRDLHSGVLLVRKEKKNKKKIFIQIKNI